jgi:hypothetical protein
MEQNTMTVKELIAELQKHDQNLKVFVGSVDVFPTIVIKEFVVQDDVGETALSISAA